MSAYELEKLVIGKNGNQYTLTPDTTLAKAGVPADAKATGDAIDDVKGSLNDKANTDGSYESMTVGNAEQLVSTVFTDDNEPYNFRSAGGNNDIGDRLYEKLVGVSLPWNQLVRNADFSDGTNYFTMNTPTYGTLEVVSGAIKFTLTASAAENSSTYIASTPGSAHVLPANRVALASAKIKPSRNTRVRFAYANIADGAKADAITADVWNDYTHIIKSKAEFSTAFAFYINVNTELQENDTVEMKNPQVIDLTQMFGSTIADYIYGLETANAGAGVAWFRKLFPKDYYAYDAGSLQSVQAKKHVTVGFNQMNPQKYIGSAYNGTPGNTISSQSEAAVTGENPIKITVSSSWAGACFVSDPLVKGQAYQSTLSFTSPTASNIRATEYFIDENNVVDTKLNNYSNAATINRSFTPTKDGLRYAVSVALNTTGTVEVSDLCLHLKWDGERDGEYEAYNKHEYPLADTTLRGIPKLDASNHLYYDGDTYESDGTVTRRYAVVTLNGSESWISLGSGADENTKRAICSGFDDGALPNLTDYNANLIGTYITGYASSTPPLWNATINSNGNLLVGVPASIADVAEWKSYLSQHPLTMVYEITTTPTTEEAAPFQSPQVVDDFGTEEYVDAGVTASTPTRDVAIPVGHESKYSANLRAKLEMAPDSPSDGDGDYLVRQTSGQNEYVKYVSPIPTLPSENGTYTLKVTVSGSTKTMSWVADT